jgi:hypothetical protein
VGGPGPFGSRTGRDRWFETSRAHVPGPGHTCTPLTSKRVPADHRGLGHGKSSARAAIAAELEPEVVCVELGDVVPIPAWPTLAWRQESTEAVVRLALEHQAEGRHPLLSGDPAALFPDHVAFAAWMRAHAEDPSHVPEVLTTNAWEVMRWERWTDRHAGDPGWNVTVIDTSPPLELSAAETS